MPDWSPISGEWLLIWAILISLTVFIRFLVKNRPSLDAQTPDDPDKLSPTELDRYQRHLVLHEIGGVGQQRLKQARVLVVGAGGLGAPILAYLGAAGVGRIGVIDDDVISHSNLQRQILFDDQDIDRPKVIVAAQKLAAQNPHLDIRPYQRRLSAEIAAELFADYDLIVDGTDNFEARAMMNAAAVETKTPLLFGAITQWEGQISLFDPAHGTPCYACIFPNKPADGLAPNCAEAGVIGALPGVVGSMMAAEAIKYLTQAGETLAGRMLLLNLLSHEYRVVKLARDKTCKICGGSH